MNYYYYFFSFAHFFFLISVSNFPRYDKLLEEYGQEELDQWKLVRVSEDFRVIALGLPVPRYVGNPLDPPLRSRFQVSKGRGGGREQGKVWQHLTLIVQCIDVHMPRGM